MPFNHQSMKIAVFSVIFFTYFPIIFYSVCKGPILINDLRSLLLVKGCREIDGSLTISINGGCEQKYFYFNHSNSDSDHSKGCGRKHKN